MDRYTLSQIKLTILKCSFLFFSLAFGFSYYYLVVWLDNGFILIVFVCRDNNAATWALAGGAVLIGVPLAVCTNDNARFWAGDHIPYAKVALHSLGYCVERPQPVK